MEDHEARDSIILSLNTAADRAAFLKQLPANHPGRPTVIADLFAFLLVSERMFSAAGFYSTWQLPSGSLEESVDAIITEGKAENLIEQRMLDLGTRVTKNGL